MHSWDIRAGLDPPGHLLDSSLPVLIDLIGRWFELLFTPDPGQARSWRLRFGYPAVVVGMLLVCVVLYRLFRRAGWL